LPWRPDFFVPIDPADPRNDDRLDPRGERIRVRLNREGGQLVDYVVQYETPTPDATHSHAVVLRSDMSHAPHYDRFDRFGGERRDWLPPHLTPKQTVRRALDDILRDWRTMQQDYFEGLP
jgi:hypothetical protein